jgi:hypothetical protein
MYKTAPMHVYIIVNYEYLITDFKSSTTVEVTYKRNFGNYFTAAHTGKKEVTVHSSAEKDVKRTQQAVF